MEQNQTDYFSLTQIRACDLQALFFLSSAKFATYIMEKKQLQHYYIGSKHIYHHTAEQLFNTYNELNSMDVFDI